MWLWNMSVVSTERDITASRGLCRGQAAAAGGANRYSRDTTVIYLPTRTNESNVLIDN